jgi:hypothetical protein
MMTFHKLRQDGNDYYISRPKRFQPIYEFQDKEIGEVYDFAFGMTFGKVGEHRKYRSGGQHRRKNGEVFINTFQGKLCEFGIKNFFGKYGIECSDPDLSQWELGIWDTLDVTANNKKVNVKSTKFFGDLLLLETKDWNTEGEYVPNIATGNSHYDFFVLTRIKPSGEAIMKKHRIMYCNELPNEVDLEEIIIKNGPWKFDIAGFITHEDLVDLINSRYILPQNSRLNGKMPMDAENYYVQSGDMREPTKLIDLLSD